MAISATLLKRHATKWLLLLWLQMLIALIMFAIAYHLIAKQKPLSPTLKTKEDELATIWAEAPRFSLLLRMYHGSITEYWEMFAPSYLLFFPYEQWRNSDLILIFDKDSLPDLQGSTTLSILPPRPTILLESPPPPGTTCSTWRREGYSRQIYSNFYADLTTDAPFIGIADADAFFVAKVVPEDLIENGTKPRILGYNVRNGYFPNATRSLFPGKEPIGEFMTVTGFPFIMKREHFRLFRQYIVSTLETANFEEAFHKICVTYGEYSQFDLFASYLYYYHRDEYAWHIRDNEQAHHPAFRGGRASSNPELLAFSGAKVVVMKHGGNFGHSENFPLLFTIYDYICTAAQFSERAGFCKKEPFHYQEAIQKTVEYNLVTDYLVETAFWQERFLPKNLSIFWHGRYFETPPPNAAQLHLERKEILKRYNGSWKL